MNTSQASFEDWSPDEHGMDSVQQMDQHTDQDSAPLTQEMMSTLVKQVCLEIQTSSQQHL
jgi:hypothetical protein